MKDWKSSRAWNPFEGVQSEFVCRLRRQAEPGIHVKVCLYYGQPEFCIIFLFQKKFLNYLGTNWQVVNFECFIKKIVNSEVAFCCTVAARIENVNIINDGNGRVINGLDQTKMALYCVLFLGFPRSEELTQLRELSCLKRHTKVT